MTSWEKLAPDLFDGRDVHPAISKRTDELVTEMQLNKQVSKLAEFGGPFAALCGVLSLSSHSLERAAVEFGIAASVMALSLYHDKKADDAGAKLSKVLAREAVLSLSEPGGN